MSAPYQEKNPIIMIEFHLNILKCAQSKSNSNHDPNSFAKVVLPTIPSTSNRFAR